AREAGALMMFGEKYGERVRMLTMGQNSIELCGGTHVSRTGDIGPFRITSESSVASGVRRVEAVTGPSAVELAQKDRATLTELAQSLKVAPDGLAARIKALHEEIRELKQAKARGPKVGADASKTETIAGHQVVIQHVSNASMGELLT